MNLLPFLKPAVDKVLEFIPNPAEKQRHKAEIEKLLVDAAMQGALAQLEVNKAEAQHKSIFVAGGRPFIMWVCGVGLLFNVLLSPILSIWFEMPDVDMDILYPVLMGMLGLGGLRTYEKLKGVAREVDPKF